MRHNPMDYNTTFRNIVKAMFISHTIFSFHEQYLLFKVQCRVPAGMITQDSERTLYNCLLLLDLSPSWAKLLICWGLSPL